MSKDRVTILAAGNVTGNRRLPVFIIGKSKNPMIFKNITNLFVAYTSQQKSWTNTNIFVKLYDNTFIPEVKKNLKTNCKVLLLRTMHLCIIHVTYQNVKMASLRLFFFHKMLHH